MAREPASLWRRLGAALIDGIVLSMLGRLIGLFTGAPPLDTLAIAVYVLLDVWLWFSYYVVLEATMGITVGKRAVGIRVLKDDGSPIGWPGAIIRNLLRIVDLLPVIIPYLVGAILASRSERRQRLGDRVAGTIVVRQPRT